VSIKAYFLLVACAVVTSCSTTAATPANDDEKLGFEFQGVRLKTDTFSSSVLFSGPQTFVDERMQTRGNTRRWSLVTALDKETHVRVYQVFVQITYFDKTWRFFQDAADEIAKPLDVRVDGRSVIDCSASHCTYLEGVAINLGNGAALRNYAESGYSIKVTARSGDSFVLEVSPEQIKTQLLAVDKYVQLYPTHQEAADATESASQQAIATERARLASARQEESEAAAQSQQTPAN
jgi:hypothetical protein